MSLKWELQPHPVQANSQTRAQQLHISTGLELLLEARGLTDESRMAQYLKPSLDQFRDPFLLHDMQKAVDRITKAVANHELVCVYGDYDVDGITSTTIMYETLQTLGAKVKYYIPNRFIDGYGPNPRRFRELIESGVSLIVTVDNGIAGNSSIDLANELGCDVIITDHHQRGPELPNAYATVYTRYPNAEYPFDDFCGAGMAFKTACALLGTVPMDLIGLAALGTIADLVSLTDENRVIVSLGLQQLSNTMRPGLKYLLQLTNLVGHPIDQDDVGFGIGPALNSLGRLGDAELGVKLLTCLDDATALKTANLCMAQNATRKLIVNEITEQAMAMASQKVAKGYHALVIAGHNWHRGVLGIVASRIVERYHCPVVVISKNDHESGYVGSGRSIDGFNLFEAFNNYRDHLVSFGGHAMACGLSLLPSELDAVQAHFQAAYQAQIGTEALPMVLPVDFKLPAHKISMHLYQSLQLLAPFGVDSPKPMFELDHAEVTDARQLGADGKTLKITIKINDVETLDCINFSMGTRCDSLHAGDIIDLVGSLSINYFNGNQNLQFQMVDFH